MSVSVERSTHSGFEFPTKEAFLERQNDHVRETTCLPCLHTVVWAILHAWNPTPYLPDYSFFKVPPSGKPLLTSKS